MARIRSPAYPSAALGEAIDLIGKIHATDRQHPVAREVAAQHMGFTGLTGTSDRALSAVLHFKLAEKVMKGEIRVSDLALRILHPRDEEERRLALNESAFAPTLFHQLRERYPGRPPAPATLESYLSREGFASIAIRPASRAFLETCRFLQQEGAYESDSEQAVLGPESASEREVKEPKIMQNGPAITPATPPPLSGLRSDIFTLEGGGEIIAKLPEALSQRDYDDLADWLELMRKKAKRKIIQTRSDEPKTDDDGLMQVDL